MKVSFWFWSVDWTREAILGCHFELWDLVKSIFLNKKIIVIKYEPTKIIGNKNTVSISIHNISIAKKAKIAFIFSVLHHHSSW